jgi:S-adenosylhomocysteine hydrolase
MEGVFRSMNQYLNDPDYLFSILTALVKKNGGKITLSKEEMDDVSKGDLIGMYYEPKTGNLILKEVDPKDMLQATTIIRDKKETDKVYDN